MSRGVKFIIAVICCYGSVFTAVAQTEQWSYMHRGDRCFKQGDYKAAEGNYDKALKLDTTNVKARYNLADTYLALSDLDNAMKAFDRVTKEGKERHADLCAKAYHNMGFIEQTVAGAADEQQKQQHLRKAIECYKEALRIQPNADATRYNMVLCQKQLKDSQDQQSKDQQEDPNSKNKNEQKEQSEDQQKKQQQKPDEKQGNKAPQPKDKQEQKLDRKSEQLLNYVRQREQQTKDKINVQPRKVYRGKNW